MGLRPDLTTMGKIIGGGLPCGAFGGRAEVMEFLAPLGPVYQAGTLSGNPLAMAAGIATLKELIGGKERFIRGWSGLRAAIAEGVAGVAREAGVPIDDEPGGVDVYVVLYGGAGGGFCFGGAVGCGGVWAVSPGDDGGWGVAAGFSSMRRCLSRRRMGSGRWRWC